MGYLNFGRLLKSFKYASKGLLDIVKTEQNFRFHIFAAVLAICMMFFFETSVVEKSLIVFSILFVFAAEIINSIFERIVDILRPRLHPEAKSMKDIMAAFVLIFAGGAVIIGLIIFIPKVIEGFAFL